MSSFTGVSPICCQCLLTVRMYDVNMYFHTQQMRFHVWLCKRIIFTTSMLVYVRCYAVNCKRASALCNVFFDQKRKILYETTSTEHCYDIRDKIRELHRPKRNGAGVTDTENGSNRVGHDLEKSPGIGCITSITIYS